MELRKLHNEELNDLYCSPIYCPGDQIEKNEMGGACSTYDGEKRFILCFGGKPEGKRPLGRPRHRWEDNIKIFRKWDVGVGTGLSWLGIGTGCRHL